MAAIGALRLPQLPRAVVRREANRTGPVPRGHSVPFVEKENPLRRIAAARQGPQGRRTIKPSVDASATVAAEGARENAVERQSVRANRPPDPAHRRHRASWKMMPRV